LKPEERERKSGSGLVWDNKFYGGNRTIVGFEVSQAMPIRLFGEAVGSESGKAMGSGL
jgi:hypothetical protein